MNEGFFSPTKWSSAKTQGTIARCGLCKLNRSCRSPKMKPTGENKRSILVVAEAPGKTEDYYVDPRTEQRGKQLIGKAGQYLRNEMIDLGFRLDRDCIKTNACICRPPDNRTPTNQEIAACRPNLLKTIREYKPNVIILMGRIAIDSFMPMVWKEKEELGGLNTWLGWNIPCQQFNAWVCPTYHPSYMLRTNNDLLQTFFHQHLEQALKHKSPPWEHVPDYKNEVEVITKPSQAARAIRWLLKLKPKLTAVDYEANCLKPEEVGSEIVSCSLCYNKDMTFSFPWAGDVIEAIVEFWKSPIPKIAANLKYEDRWTWNKLKVRVRNWAWDTMIAAHVLDMRRGITSVKFQAFVRLGFESYNDNIHPYLIPKDGHGLNRIREIPIIDLLLYGGLDSKVEWLIADQQIKEMRERE